MDFDTIIKNIEQKIETGTMKLEYINQVLKENKIEDTFTFIKTLIDKSTIISNYLSKFLQGKTKYNEDDIYNTFGETNGDILFCYASLKNLIVEDDLDYSYGDSKDLYSEALFFSEIRDIPIMDKNVTNNYIANFQKYKKLYEESKNPEEKAIYERKYIFYQNQVIEGNIRLIISIANKKTRYGLELNELINEGTFGMIKAMERFDASLGFAFSTYATCWLRQSISRAIEEKGRTIRIPSAQYQVYNKYLTAVKTLSLKLNREPSLEELADYLEMDLKKLTHLVVSFSENPSLDATPKDENEKDQENMFNFLKSGEFEDRVVDSITLNHLLSGLTEKERYIITLRYFNNYTLEQVGDILGVTRERIRQKEKKILSKMYEISKTTKKSLLEYLNISNTEIFKIVATLDNHSKVLLHKEFGYGLNKKVVQKKFSEPEIRKILDEIMEEYRKSQNERKSPILFTLEELLNGYPKGSMEYDETSQRIKILWEEQDKDTFIYKLMFRAFGFDGTKLYNKDDFTPGENNLIFNKIERFRFNLRCWPKHVDNSKTLEDLLNKAPNKEEHDEINKRIAYLWQEQDKTTLIYSIMIKAFGIDGKGKYNAEKLTSRERNALDNRLNNWSTKLLKANFWPKEKSNANSYEGKYLWELLHVTKEELFIIAKSLNRNAKFYQVLVKCFGPTFEDAIKLKNISENDLKLLYANIPKMRKKINEPTPYLRKTLKEILGFEVPYALKEDYLLAKTFGPNLDEPYLNTLNVSDTRKLTVLLKEIQTKYKSTKITKEEPEKVVSPEEILLINIANMMSDDVKEPFMLYFGLIDGDRYKVEDIALKLNCNLCKVKMKIQEGINFVKDILKTYEDNFDENFVRTEEILKRLR